MSDDKIYSKKIDQISDFVFDEKVAAVFENMLSRSIPGYNSLLSLLTIMVDEYYQPGTVCYDLGCSLGAVSLVLARQLSQRHQDFQVIAVDNSAAMIERCQSNIATAGFSGNIQTKLADVKSFQLSNASLVALNFTLQFVEPEKKQAVLAAIYQGLTPGGCLLISEKSQADDPDLLQQQEQLYYRFKKMNAYSDLEIRQKKAALAKVLFPESTQTLNRRLHAAGFKFVSRWFQCLQFESFCAIK